MADLRRQIRDTLAGGSGLGGGLPTDVAPLDAVIRAYQEGTPAGGEIALGVGDCLFDDDPSVRGQAALFFERFPAAPGAEALTRVWQTRPELYLGVDNPRRCGPTTSSAMRPRAPMGASAGFR